MRTRIGFMALAVAVLGICLLGMGQGRSGDAGRMPGASRAVASPKQRIDPNEATVEELLKIPGMTRVWAARIVRFRPYRTRMNLLDRGVVTDEVYDRIKDYLIVHREKE